MSAHPELDVEYLFYFHSDSLQVVEAKVLGLPEDSPPGEVYYWLTHDEETREITRLSFVSMESENHRQSRQFDEGELRFDRSLALLSLNEPPGEFKLEVRNSDSVPGELDDRVRAFLQCSEGLIVWAENLYEFFNSSAKTWDAKFGDGSGPVYETVAQQVSPSNEVIRILDLGCGTGNNLHQIFPRVPYAEITGIDVAPNMLKQLEFKFQSHLHQISLIQGHILDLPFGQEPYDYVTSVLTMHHFPPENKARIYRKIREALKDDGLYIEGDQSILLEKEDLHLYERYLSQLPAAIVLSGTSLNNS